MKRFKKHLEEGIAGFAGGAAAGGAAGYAKWGIPGAIGGAFLGGKAGSGVEDGYKATRRKKKVSEDEESLATHANKTIKKKKLAAAIQDYQEED